MPPRKSGISAATLVLSDESGHMIDMPFLTIHLRSRQGQFSVSASDACASLAFARGATVILGVPLGHRRVSCRTRAVATTSAMGQEQTSPVTKPMSALPPKADKQQIVSSRDERHRWSRGDIWERCETLQRIQRHPGCDAALSPASAFRLRIARYPLLSTLQKSLSIMLWALRPEAKASCLLWVKSGKLNLSMRCPLYPESGHRLTGRACQLSAKMYGPAVRYKMDFRDQRTWELHQCIRPLKWS